MLLQVPHMQQLHTLASSQSISIGSCTYITLQKIRNLGTWYRSLHVLGRSELKALKIEGDAYHILL